MRTPMGSDFSGMRRNRRTDNTFVRDSVAVLKLQRNSAYLSGVTCFQG